MVAGEKTWRCFVTGGEERVEKRQGRGQQRAAAHAWGRVRLPWGAGQAHPRAPPRPALTPCPT